MLKSRGMYFIRILCFASVALGLVVDNKIAPRAHASSDQRTIAKLQKTYEKNLAKELANNSGCTMKGIGVRKSWSSLSVAERTDYLRAVKCMASRPNQISRKTVPGARNRLDDFLYSHLNQTDFIHLSGLFLPWHRQFVWAYEQAIRTECNYKGYLPYWDWAEYSQDQSLSPVFDGTPTSFGGNGKPVPHSAQNASQVGLPTPIFIYRPAGTGGGCVADGSGGLGGLGPKFTVRLGPVSPADNPPDNLYGLKCNPRCLVRDFLPSASQSALTYGNVSSLLQSPNISAFHFAIDYLMHPNTHSTIGGDAFDLFTSPNDPVFYLLHSMIDRLWTVWQGQDFAGRTDGLDGTVTFLNDPPSQNATLDTTLIMQLAGGDIPIANVMSTYQNSYCYMYA